MDININPWPNSTSPPSKSTSPPSILYACSSTYWAGTAPVLRQAGTATPQARPPSPAAPWPSWAAWSPSRWSPMWAGPTSSSACACGNTSPAAMPKTCSSSPTNKPAHRKASGTGSNATNTPRPVNPASHPAATNTSRGSPSICLPASFKPWWWSCLSWTHQAACRCWKLPAVLLRRWTSKKPPKNSSPPTSSSTWRCWSTSTA